MAAEHGRHDSPSDMSSTSSKRLYTSGAGCRRAIMMVAPYSSLLLLAHGVTWPGNSHTAAQCSPQAQLPAQQAGLQLLISLQAGHTAHFQAAHLQVAHVAHGLDDLEGGAGVEASADLVLHTSTHTSEPAAPAAPPGRQAPAAHWLTSRILAQHRTHAT